MAPAMRPTGRQLDLSSDPVPAAPSAKGGAFLGVTFDCCRVYARIYPNRAGDAYKGRCPKCGGAVRVLIGPGGSSSRFFTAS